MSQWYPKHLPRETTSCGLYHGSPYSGEYEEVGPDLRLELMVQLMGNCSELDTGKAIVYYGLCIDMAP